MNSEISRRWHSSVVLKRDLFSTVERGRWRSGDDEVDAVLRRIDDVPWFSRPVAHHLFKREARALSVAPAGLGPALLFQTGDMLVRGFISGVPLHIAEPKGDRGYFVSAKAVLRGLHRAGICHNDLAKRQNWLRKPNGQAAVTDFQLAGIFQRRGKLFRVLAYEDLRHLLKHKRSYVPEALTPRERKILARKSLLTRVWMATGKRVYYAITRGLFNFTDREGAGLRLINDAPRIVTRLRQHPQVRDAVVVSYPERRSGTGLYAFVESSALQEQELRDFLTSADAPAAPERIQPVTALPRRPDGTARVELLQLVAMNQLDLIDPLIDNEHERATVAEIVAARRNLRDRFAF
jgi:predicted Ser/Thr protein kinase